MTLAELGLAKRAVGPLSADWTHPSRQSKTDKQGRTNARRMWRPHGIFMSGVFLFAVTH
jgi:hypothetical protein